MVALLFVGVCVAVIGNVLNGLSIVRQKRAHERAKATNTHYARHALWWLGISMNIAGEVGNLIAYTFAPAAVVAPLGAVTVIANALESRRALGERVTRTSAYGVFMCVFGASSVVFAVAMSGGSGSADYTTLNWTHVVSLKFVAFITLDASALIVLLPVKRPVAARSVMYYVYACSCLSSMLVVGLKGVMTFVLVSALRGDALIAFGSPVFYALLVWFVVCLITQNSLFNEALASYDASKLVPPYFVLYVLGSILGAAILYGELDNVRWLEAFVMAIGCTATFIGVHLSLIASPPRPPAPDAELVADDV
jgi:hypothetical protein